MARILAARTLTLARPSAARPALRLRASRALSGKVDFIEIDLSEESPSSSSGGGGEGDPTTVQVRAGMRRLEDAIRGVLVRRAAPDWLPFVPGASYWVPPMPRSLGVADLLSGSVYAARGAAPMTEEEALSFTTVQGWPSAEYFVEGERWIKLAFYSGCEMMVEADYGCWFMRAYNLYGNVSLEFIGNLAPAEEAARSCEAPMTIVHIDC
ncbi:hypothetical protein U9M48_033736 [Paspalum notatum var. saurae]|uniref:Uncharacterized protein n=1 Tax=Paspalum notatum var. saurae TaxID=547442 RepID=A0AAQ3UBA2_PASNO